MKIRLTILIFLSLLKNVEAHPGTGIVEDSKGNIFYTDLSRVWKIDITGKKTVVVPNVHTHELFMDVQDNLFGEHLWYNGEAKKTWSFYVWKLSATGSLNKIIPDKEGFRDDEGFSFVQDHLGSMFIPDRTNSCQRVIKKRGNQQDTYSKACFHNIRNMKVGKKGDLLLVDFQDVVRIDIAGQSRTVATKIANKSWTTSNTENQNSVFGIWDDSEGNIYTAVYSNREVVKFAHNSTQTVVWKASLPWAPTGGLISKKKELWVLEASVTEAVRVVRVGSDGKTQIID